MTELKITDLPLDGMEAVVFDLDGTLYDKRLLPLRLIFSDLRHCTLLASERRARRLLKGQDFGNPEAFYNTLFSHISSHQNIPFMKARDWYFGSYLPQTIRVLNRYYKGAAFVNPLLEELRKRNIKTAVFSDYRCVEEKLEALGLDYKMFDYIFVAPDMGGLKPNKHLFEKILDNLGLPADKVLMIGDREDTDGAGANAVGMRYLKV